MTQTANPPLHYPQKGFMKWFFKSPLLAWRSGYGFLLGRWILILTTTGHKSGMPRHTPLQFFGGHDRKYVISGWGEKANWYKNMMTYPNVTIQSAYGVEAVNGRVVKEDADFIEAFQRCQHDPIMRWWLQSLDIPITQEAFLANKDNFTLITFDPTSEPTPPPLHADLVWTNWVLGGWLVWRILRGKRG